MDLKIAVKAFFGGLFAVEFGGFGLDKSGLSLVEHLNFWFLR